ncbi:DUF1822 family protein [Anabaena sp. AL93]|uniref:DUF1822 family protein n=1 Tax=Anabaena sp. AL93 TaxID=1678133 RepID=UPI0007FC46D5|nr:DUF1822 family protein [Anabaena sp. AL93]OBQ22647.1 MAG: hypothetical protein AN486_01895 [Anabaena sp. AL93]
MNNLSNNLTNNRYLMPLEFEVLPTTAINLDTEQINQAVENSLKIKNQSQQWQTYINTLALLAFKEWLTERADSLTVNEDKCTVFQPAIANVIPAVANLQVGKFKVCLLTNDSLSDDEIVVPRAVVDLPEYIAHFYVLIEVLEEQETAIVFGFLSYQQLIKKQTVANLQPEADWTYQIPVSWFEQKPDDLLLYLRCLEANAIILPAINNQRTQILASMQNELMALLPQLQLPNIELWQVLTWEQGSAVITNIELLNWLDNLQQQGHNYSLQNSLKDLFKLLTQPAINVGRWLWDELDELAQELSWQLLPIIAPAPVMRSPVEEFQVITNQLQSRGLEISSQARGAYHDLLLAGIPLRLYAVTWTILSESDPLWTLLLVLGTSAQNTLPGHLKLRVSDQTSILVEQGINQEQGDSYLFTRVVGNWDEKFLVSVSLVDGVELTLPPFTFYPGRSH